MSPQTLPCSISRAPTRACHILCRDFHAQHTTNRALPSTTRKNVTPPYYVAAHTRSTQADTPAHVTHAIRGKNCSRGPGDDTHAIFDEIIFSLIRLDNFRLAASTETSPSLTTAPATRTVRTSIKHSTRNAGYALGRTLSPQNL